MAARFVVGLAVIALCHSSPVLINGYEDSRDGRSLSLSKGVASGFGDNKVTAQVNRDGVHATGYNSGANLGPGQAFADARNYDNADQAAIDIARTQGYYHPYYHVAQPAVITYNQNIVPSEQLVYQPLSGAPSSAVSTAITDGNSESSLSSATNHGSDGVAESKSETLGNYGKTNTVAKTVGKYNTAASNANTRLGVVSVDSKASSSEGSGSASSNAQTNGFAYPIGAIAPAVEPSVIDAKYHSFYNPALYGSASSNANTVGHGSADSSARVGPARRSISWRFGTAYDTPAGYGAIKTVPTLYQPAPVVYQPAPVVYKTEPAAVNPYGATKSSANTQGSGNAQSNAQLNAGYGSTKSTANSKDNGQAQANANINNNRYGLYRSDAIGSGVAKTSANTNGLGFADSNANLNQGSGFTKSVANSNGGFANANADISNYASGLYRTTGEVAPWSRTISDSKSTGFGSAVSSAHGNQYEKVANSFAKNSGWGSSIAHSQTL